MLYTELADSLHLKWVRKQSIDCSFYCF